MTTVLEGLLAQAEAQGVPRVTLQAIVEEAAQAGAARALRSLGLMDEKAGNDIVELRQLIQAWRDARRSALRMVAGWLLRTVLALVLLGAAYKFGLLEGHRA